MRKLFASLAIVAAVAIGFTSCKKDESKSDNPTPPNTHDSSLTPSEHQEKLEDIALDFIDEFNTADVEPLAESVLTLFDYLSFSGDYNEVYPMMAQLGEGVRKFSADEIEAFATRFYETIVIDINDPEFNPFVGMRMEYDGEEWIVTEIGENEMQLVWDNAVATAVWENCVEQSIVIDDVEYVAFVPKKVRFDIKLDGKEHFVLDIYDKIAGVDNLSLAFEVCINGGYRLLTATEVTAKGLTLTSIFSKGNKMLLSSSVNVSLKPGNDPWIEELLEAWFEDMDGMFDILDSVNFTNAAIQLDIETLRVIATGDLTDLFDTLADYAERYDMEGKEYCEKVCKLINDKLVVALYYSDTNEKVADVVMEVVSNEFSYDDIYYVSRPVLLFPDGSKFTFDEYFNEQAFGDAIDSLFELMNDCYELLDY